MWEWPGNRLYICSTVTRHKSGSGLGTGYSYVALGHDTNLGVAWEQGYTSGGREHRLVLEFCTA